MNKKYIFVPCFFGGTIIGALITWKYVEKRYSNLADSEIKSVKETVMNRIREAEDKIEKLEEENENLRAKLEPVETPEKEKPKNYKTKPDIAEYATLLNGSGYTKYGNPQKQSEGDEPLQQPDDDGEENNAKLSIPYVITPDQFGEAMEYDQISLVYYADGVLTDDDDQLVEDIANTVGVDFASHFGEYEDDSVFIRNDVLKNEYEILADRRSYSDIIKRKPHRVD